jgi:hypothetical protein
MPAPQVRQAMRDRLRERGRQRKQWKADRAKFRLDHDSNDRPRGNGEGSNPAPPMN